MAKKVSKRGLAEASAGVYQHLPRPTLTGTVADLDAKYGIDRKETAKAAAKAIGVAAAAAVGYQTGAFASPNFMAGLTGSLFEAAGTVLGTRQKQQSDEGRLWALVRGALDLGWLAIAKEALAAEKRDPEKLAAAVTTSLDAAIQFQTVTIDGDFFGRPEALPVVPLARAALTRWLREAVDVSEFQADSAAGHLPAAFLAALRAVAARDPGAVARITDRLATPFDAADERLRARAAYAARLEADLALPLFDGPASLRDLYQPLRAYCIVDRERPDSDRLDARRGEIGRFREKRCVVELATALNAWLETSDAADALRVVSGGPGSGKSSFARWWAVETAVAGSWRVLLVPLHRLEDSGGALADRLDRFARDRARLVEDPLRSGEPLLLILDGLDELVMQGNSGAEVAEGLIRDVAQLLRNAQDDGRRLRVLLGGREILVDRLKERLSLRPILHLLPYRLGKEEQGRSGCDWDDSATLLDLDSKPENDLRHAWWRAWGAATGEKLDGVPKEIEGREKLVALSEQPLLNFLLALARQAPGGLSADMGVNTVYAKLLYDVWRRRWGSARGQEDGRLDAHRGLSFDAFERVFQAISVAAWHSGAIRAVTTHAIKEAIGRERLAEQLQLLQDAGQEGALRLLTAFYWREAGTSASGERAWELTHKNFGEYLVARRLVRAVERSAEMRRRNRQEADDGWTIERALIEWIVLAGPSTIDDELLSMLRREIALNGKSTTIAWQKTLIELLNWQMRHGLPMHKADPALPSFQEACRQARNAERTLIATLNACARSNEKISRPDWPSDDPKIPRGSRTASDIIKKFMEPNAFSHINALTNSSIKFRTSDSILERTDFSGQYLIFSLLSGCNMSYCKFFRSVLAFSDFLGANLRQTHFTNAFLIKSNFRHSALVNAKLRSADLDYADFTQADLTGADFSHASLDGTVFNGANITKTDFRLARKLTLKQLKEALNIEDALLPDNFLMSRRRSACDFPQLSPHIALPARLSGTSGADPRQARRPLVTKAVTTPTAFV